MVALAWLINLTMMTLRLSGSPPPRTLGRATIAGLVVSDEFSMRWCDDVHSPSLYVLALKFQTNRKMEHN